MQDNQDIIYGIHPVMEALRSKKRNVTQLYVSDSKAGHRSVEDIIRLAKRANVRIDRIDNKTTVILNVTSLCRNCDID